MNVFFWSPLAPSAQATIISVHVVLTHVLRITFGLFAVH